VLIGASLACASVLSLAGSGSLQGLCADINGDRALDAVSLVRRARSFVLRVDTGSRVITKTVQGFSGGQASAMGYPRMVALRPLNPHPGLEIEVLLWAGAANDFLVLYTLDRGKLVALTGGPPDPGGTASVWNLGGTVGTGTTEADCVLRRQVGVIEHWYDGRRWHSRAARYAVRATRFVRVATYRLVSEQPPWDRSLPHDWPHLKNREFRSCGGLELSQ
jgi:hypothetical protein